LQGLENGPTPGYDQGGVSHISQAQKNMRAMLASKDGLAIDVVQTNIMNWDMEHVHYLNYLTQKGTAGNGNTKNIVVRGIKVDDIRTDFEGTIPPTGGRKLTAEQKALPSVAINSVSFEGQNLRLGLNISDNTDKLDIYIDGQYAGSVSGNMTDITFNAMGFDNGARNITVYAYTQYMYHAAASATAEKSAEKIVLGQFDYAAPFAETAPRGQEPNGGRSIRNGWALSRAPTFFQADIK
jgi:hypothetical protein